MTDLVFDTEPLIAYFYDEPGAADVAERLQRVLDGAATGAISHATAVEIVYKVARLETGAPNRTDPSDNEYEIGRRDLRTLRGFDLTIETPPLDPVARVKGSGSISLGDAYAVALAQELDATLVVGADSDFGSIPVDVDVHRVRSDPVR